MFVTRRCVFGSNIGYNKSFVDWGFTCRAYSPPQTRRQFKDGPSGKNRKREKRNL